MQSVEKSEDGFWWEVTCRPLPLGVHNWSSDLAKVYARQVHKLSTLSTGYALEVWRNCEYPVGMQWSVTSVVITCRYGVYILSTEVKLTLLLRYAYYPQNINTVNRL